MQNVGLLELTLANRHQIQIFNKPLTPTELSGVNYTLKPSKSMLVGVHCKGHKNLHKISASMGLFGHYFDLAEKTG